jgi:hypothetical protein
MKKKDIFVRYILIILVLLLGILYVAKYGGPSILRLYVESGIGTCEKIPILCMTPDPGIITPQINKEYIAELLPREFPTMSIYAPKDFTVVKENIKKVYYKKYKRKHSGSVIYILHEDPDFFINLFPQLTKQGIDSDYEFIKRTMLAKLKDIKNLTDTFFVIMKSVFSPDLGDLRNVKMVQFILTDKKGFINYNLSNSGNYFDCNIIDASGDLFKISIKDKDAGLDLDKVLAIISTVNKHK